MSRGKKVTELIHHKEASINLLATYIDNLINNNSSDEKEKADLKKKADLLCYWVKDYVNFLKKEHSFNPKKLKRYERGEIVKVHLGFRVGSEEGGLHYAVVLDKDNALSSPTLTVVPLTSVKEKTDVNNLHKGNVYLGNELFNSIILKSNAVIKSTQCLLAECKEQLKNISDDNIDEINDKIDKLSKQLLLTNRIRNEANKMKRGSIAIVSQVVTISKIRIYDPKVSEDVLAGIKLSDVSLNKIDKEIICNFTKVELDEK